MIKFLFTTFFGIIFVFSMLLLIVGFMFMLRTALILWFDKDFMVKLNDWWEWFTKGVQ